MTETNTNEHTKEIQGKRDHAKTEEKLQNVSER